MESRKHSFSSTEGWEKVVRHAPWVAGQSTNLTPGGEKAISRRRHSKKYRARGKHVVRPRIRKQQRPDTKQK